MPHPSHPLDPSLYFTTKAFLCFCAVRDWPNYKNPDIPQVLFQNCFYNWVYNCRWTICYSLFHSISGVDNRLLNLFEFLPCFPFFISLFLFSSEERTEGLSEAKEDSEKYLAQTSKLRQEVSEKKKNINMTFRTRGRSCVQLTCSDVHKRSSRYSKVLSDFSASIERIYI
jgi:hypothetical protein